MRNLDITDTRDKLMIYTRAGVLQSAGDALLPKLADDDEAKA
jgi:argininosuccinate synthase